MALVTNLDLHGASVMMSQDTAGEDPLDGLRRGSPEIASATLEEATKEGQQP